jgi:hypothetical protein
MGSVAKGLLLSMILALIPISAYGTNHAGPRTPSCGNYKVSTNEIIAGVKFPKGSYQINAFGISCTKVMGNKGLFAKFLKLKDKDPLPKPWQYLADAVGAPKFSSGPGVGFRVQLITPTSTSTPTPTPEVPYVGATEIERNLYLKMDAIVKEWASYLSALNNNKFKVISENPSHPRNEENRLSAEVSLEILGKILPKMVSPTYYMYETAEWADKQMASTCPRLVGQNPTGTRAGAQVGCGKLVIVNLNGWNNNIAGIDGSWLESAHELFHIAQFVAAIVGNDPNNSLSYPYHPAWYREGSATTFGGLVRSLMSQGKYNYGDLNRFEKSPVSYSDCDKAWAYWQQNNNATGFSDLGQCEYGLGRRMTDYLVAWHGGVAAILKNYEYVAQGKTFEEAFKLAHGVTLREFFQEVKPFLVTQGFAIP